jgi:signal transduction histidine kinase
MIVIGLVFAVAWGVTAGGRFMPLLIKDGALIVPLGIHLTGLITLTNALALWLLWTRGRSVLDLWLTVAVCALTAESLMVSLSLTPRYSVGWYSARLISLLVSKVVLIVLLSETAILQIRLSVANRKLERERENKLTSAETVVAALAHEVRQPLSGMTSRAAAGRRFLDRAPPDPNIDKAKTLFEQLGDAAFRANDVFESFLGLFREGSREHQSVDMNALALEAVELLRKELEDHNIVAHMMLAPELPVVQGNRGQLREVILNLLQNSIDAMATTPRQRVISFETARHDPGSISISLEDTGPGIDPNKLANIFDAFVTTKAKGTGLGLAICKMIIERHGGKLSVSSDTHYGGARFEVSLPTNLAAALGAKASASGDALKQV